MQLNTVFYQILTPGPLVKADGSVDLRMVAMCNSLGEASQIVDAHKLQKFVIICSVCVISELQTPQPVDINNLVNPAQLRQ